MLVYLAQRDYRYCGAIHLLFFVFFVYFASSC